MGNTNSSNDTPSNCCELCAGEVFSGNQDRVKCVRCHTYRSLISKQSISVPLKSIRLQPFDEGFGSIRNRYRDNMSDVANQLVLPYLLQENIEVVPNTVLEIANCKFKITTCFPSFGKPTRNVTRVYVDRPIRRNPLHKIEFQIAYNNGSRSHNIIDNFSRDKIVKDYIKPYLESEGLGIHFSQGDTFVHKNIQFVVSASKPIQGVFSTNTECFLSSRPILDARRLHILPLSDDLSPEESQMSRNTMFKRLVRPYLTGRTFVISKNSLVHLGHRRFQVVGVEPNPSLPNLHQIYRENDDLITTSETEIFLDGPLMTFNDYRTQQDQRRFISDFEMLQALSHNSGFSDLLYHSTLMPAALHNQRSNNRSPQIDPNMMLLLALNHPDIQEALNSSRTRSPEYMADVFNTLLQSQPPRDPNAPTPATKEQIDQLTVIPYSPEPHPERMLIQHCGESDENFAKRLEEEVKSWKERVENEAKCLVCFEDYKTGSELMMLPCMHKFCQPCIKQWLQLNNQCPICRVDIFGGQSSSV